MIERFALPIVAGDKALGNEALFLSCCPSNNNKWTTDVVVILTSQNRPINKLDCIILNIK
jgi:hypothetical protein